MTTPRVLLFAGALTLACQRPNPEFDAQASGKESSTSGEASGDGDGEPTAGDGEPTTGDGDGEPTAGDGDGEPTAGDGDGDDFPGDGDGDDFPGDGDGDDFPGDGDGDDFDTDGLCATGLTLPDPICQACIEGSCCPEILDCEGDMDCACVATCVFQGDPPEACIMGCLPGPNGFDLAVLTFMCVDDSCDGICEF